MAPLSRMYHDQIVRPVVSLTDALAHLGGPRRRNEKMRYEQPDRFWRTDRRGSHMPIDADVHWDWRNPLNIIPAMLLAVAGIAIVGIAI